MATEEPLLSPSPNGAISRICHLGGILRRLAVQPAVDFWVLIEQMETKLDLCQHAAAALVNELVERRIETAARSYPEKRYDRINARNGTRQDFGARRGNAFSQRVFRPQRRSDHPR